MSFSAAQVYRSVFPILEFISCFLSAKKHSFHTSASMQCEHVYTDGTFTWADGGGRGSQSPEALSAGDQLQILKSLLEEGFWGAHTGGVNSEPCVGLCFRFSGAPSFFPSQAEQALDRLAVSSCRTGFLSSLVLSVYLVHTAHGVQPL